MYIGLHVKYLLFLSDFNETFLTDFQKILRYPISWNTSIGSQVVPHGWMDGQTGRHTTRQS